MFALNVKSIFSLMPTRLLLFVGVAVCSLKTVRGVIHQGVIPVEIIMKQNFLKENKVYSQS